MMRCLERTKLSGPLRWSYHFRVTGNGAFPIDMLRYDSCFPYTSEDAANLDWDRTSRETRREVRTVTLVHLYDSAVWEPTVGRWNSFMWSVVDAD